MSDHFNEYFPIVLEKVMNKRNINLLHTMPKLDILNSKNLHVVTRSRVGEEIYSEPPIRKRGGQNAYPDPEHEEIHYLNFM